jgi:hypothetical protein
MYIWIIFFHGGFSAHEVWQGDECNLCRTDCEMRGSWTINTLLLLLFAHQVQSIIYPSAGNVNHIVLKFFNTQTKSSDPPAWIQKIIGMSAILVQGRSSLSATPVPCWLWRGHFAAPFFCPPCTSWSLQHPIHNFHSQFSFIHKLIWISINIFDISLRMPLIQFNSLFWYIDWIFCLS